MSDSIRRVPKKLKKDQALSDCFRVEFDDAMEIRMGSPYNVCRIRVSGDWIPALPETDWQDISAWRADRGAVALVRWDVGGNVPGFRLVILDSGRKSIEVSDRVSGCCSYLKWKNFQTIVWKAFCQLEGYYSIKGGLPDFHWPADPP